MDQESLSRTAQAASGWELSSLPESSVWQSLYQSDSDIDVYAGHWLTIQSALINKAEQSVVVLKQRGQFQAVASWPDQRKPILSDSRLSEVAELALHQEKTVVLPGDRDADSAVIAFPLHQSAEIVGVVAVEIQTSNKDELSYILRQLQWGSAWLLNRYQHELSPSAGFTDRLGLAIKLVAICLDQQRFLGAASAVCTEWATRFHCDRVSLGYIENQHTRIHAISHNAQFERRSKLCHQLSKAMDEAVDQKSIVCVPQDDESLIVNLAHQQLLGEDSVASICTLPLFRQNISGATVIGAVTLEHAEPDFFHHQRIQQCEQIAALLGPLLDDKRLDDRWVGVKLLEAATEPVKKLLGRGHYTLKLSTILACAVIVLFSVVTGDFHVSAPASIEGWTQRHISAPIDGFLLTSHVRAGDLVREGQPLYELDNRDLRLEQLKWLKKKEQIEKQHIEALVGRDATKAGVLLAQMTQVQAQLELIAEQLSRTEAKAPFAGVVVKGDLSQREGAPVQRGETLLQIAPLDNYRIMLDVLERDIAHVQVGQIGSIKLTALSGQIFDLIIESVMPIAESTEGRNTFRVEARLNAESSELRPGMEGTVRVAVGERRLIWIWTHNLVDWFRVWIWTWWP